MFSVVCNRWYIATGTWQVFNQHCSLSLLMPAKSRWRHTFQQLGFFAFIRWWLTSTWRHYFAGWNSVTVSIAFRFPASGKSAFWRNLVRPPRYCCELLRGRHWLNWKEDRIWNSWQGLNPSYWSHSPVTCTLSHRSQRTLFFAMPSFVCGSQERLSSAPHRFLFSRRSPALTCFGFSSLSHELFDFWTSPNKVGQSGALASLSLSTYIDSRGRSWWLSMSSSPSK